MQASINNGFPHWRLVSLAIWLRLYKFYASQLLAERRSIKFFLLWESEISNWAIDVFNCSTHGSHSHFHLYLILRNKQRIGTYCIICKIDLTWILYELCFSPKIWNRVWEHIKLSLSNFLPILIHDIPKFLIADASPLIICLAWIWVD